MLATLWSALDFLAEFNCPLKWCVQRLHVRLSAYRTFSKEILQSNDHDAIRTAQNHIDRPELYRTNKLYSGNMPGNSTSFWRLWSTTTRETAMTQEDTHTQVSKLRAFLLQRNLCRKMLPKWFWNLRRSCRCRRWSWEFWRVLWTTTHCKKTQEITHRCCTSQPSVETYGIWAGTRVLSFQDKSIPLLPHS